MSCQVLRRNLIVSRLRSICLSCRLLLLLEWAFCTTCVSEYRSSLCSAEREVNFLPVSWSVLRAQVNLMIYQCVHCASHISRNGFQSEFKLQGGTYIAFRANSNVLCFQTDPNPVLNQISLQLWYAWEGAGTRTRFVKMFLVVCRMQPRKHIVLPSQADRNNRESQVSGMFFAPGQKELSSSVVIASYHHPGSQSGTCWAWAVY